MKTMPVLLGPGPRLAGNRNPGGMRLAGRPSPASAFTMVEIAISIAIVAFAMVAIIGVLPTGFQVQKENREDTMLIQEGNFWLETLRSGPRGLDYLTNYVELIRLDVVSRSWNRPEGQALGYSYRYRAGSADGRNFTTNRGFVSGRDIVGLLSIPAYYSWSGGEIRALGTEAYVRAVTGSAAEKTSKASGNDFGFMYRMAVQLTPFNPLPGRGAWSTNLGEFNLKPEEWTARSNLILRTHTLNANLYELQLTLQWPVLPRGAGYSVGDNQRVFRTLVSGAMGTTNVDYLTHRTLFFLQPSEFVFTR